MKQFKDLFEFVNLAEKNRKYATNTAHGRRAALKVFEKELNEQELDSVDSIQENMEEIFQNVLSKNKDSYSIGSLNTYKVRLLKVIEDYKKYGQNPSHIELWETRPRKIYTPVNNQDTFKDTSVHKPSEIAHTPVHKLEIALASGQICVISIPVNISPKETETIKSILDALTKKLT